MKASLIGLAALSLVVLTASEAETSNISTDMSGELIACGWYPLCGDPDIYSPALQPKDATKDVRNIKEEKTA